MIIGIDLGTTFSVIAVNGQVKLTPGYPEAKYIPQCDVSIIPEPYGSTIIPSVVVEDPDQPGKLIVGVEAREMAAEGRSPIMFSKRDIGTNILHPLGERQYTAREAARVILVYLKGVAEQALGRRVDRAVITHPAYFDPAMKEETALAARDAGFDFDPEQHLLMEPIAAALSYTRTDPRDPLRILTYDLGGGTFDVTVMERRKGVVSVKAFGGNRLLGGFNFDRELARWLLQRLQARGVQVTLDESNPVDRGKWARLLRIAEDAKIQLATARTDRLPMKIRQQGIFDDDQGHPVNLQEEITRQQFVALIQDLLDGTITGPGGEGETKGCNMTLAEAGLRVEQLDEILLVGGSSAGPWIRELMQRHWGRDAQLYEPDLCVGIGAAIHASTLPEEVRGESCRVELDVPKQSVLECINVAGRILPAGTTALPAGLHALLSNPQGKKVQADVAPDGRFLFPEVELVPEAVTAFTLVVADREGRALAQHRFEVTHAPEGGGEAVGVLTVLPKPLYVEVQAGMKPLAEEGAMLPAHCEIELTRTNEDDTIEIRLFQERDLIGAVIIKDVPREAPIGSKVKLAVDISRNNRITGRAAVFTRKGAVAAEAPVDIHIPPIDVPDLTALRRQFELLESERAERIDLEPNAETRLRMQARGDKLSRRIEHALSAPGPDRQEIWLALRQLQQIIAPPVDDMEPPMEEFEQLVLHVRDMLASQGADPQVQAHGKLVERLENEGRAAHARKDQRSWAQVNANLEGLLRRLLPRESSGGGGSHRRSTAPTALQKLQANMQLDQTRQLLREREAALLQQGKLERMQGRVNRLYEDIDRAESMIEQIDDATEPQAAQSQIQLVYFQKIKPIVDQIETLGYDVK